jgi:hypothetical protein
VDVIHVEKHVVWHEQPGRLRLGRQLWWDPRSRDHFAELDEGLMRQPIRPTDWPSPLPILDQSDLHAQGIHVEGDPDALGSCTGNQLARAVAALWPRDYASLTLDGVAMGADAPEAERLAIRVYHEATLVDSEPGRWPFDDTGSSALATHKVAVRAGWAGGYDWGRTLRGIAALLQRRGGGFGMPWYNAFFSPDVHGFVDAAGWRRSGVAGGHEFYVRGVEAWDDRDPAKVVLACDNSWASAWGDAGSFRLRGSTYEALRRETDFAQLRPAA